MIAKLIIRKLIESVIEYVISIFSIKMYLCIRINTPNNKHEVQKDNNNNKVQIIKDYSVKNHLKL